MTDYLHALLPGYGTGESQFSEDSAGTRASIARTAPISGIRLATGSASLAKKSSQQSVLGLTITLNCNLRGDRLHWDMIAGFRHKGLKLLYDKGDRRRINPEHVRKIERILARLDEAVAPTDMDLPGFRLHPLKGKYAGFWAVDVSGNWRVVFRFEGVNVYDVELTDYH